MRHLILLRHAKSSWVNPDIDDFDRPLNKRGKRSAKALGTWLHESEMHPDEVLCSSARRARETCEALRLSVGVDLREDLYHAEPEVMLEVLRKASGKSVLMIGHNPGIAAFAQMLTETPPDHPRFADYPTGALLVLDFDIKNWSKAGPGKGKVRTFLTPHDLVPAEE
ncbi:SixA phosphatase family protein [Tropicimonas aquimaris]|uniref:SixA phosphatase family protein n=1 Tax=Tropicimonas aquimaris TaxID=914152 RepID=A0ABW3IR83_9RHOB